jgi:hypothetical protein
MTAAAGQAIPQGGLCDRRGDGFVTEGVSAVSQDRVRQAASVSGSQLSHYLLIRTRWYEP